jgi:hypothetical protein
MADPITLGVLGTLAATEGIKFLYNQAAELIKAYRERKKNRQDQEAESPVLDVPIKGDQVLDAPPAEGRADVQVLAEHEPKIVELHSRLTPYANDLADVPVDDAELSARVDELRGLLEAVYGQRLTFRGEHREPTGTRVTVRQVLTEVAGKVVGVQEVSGGADVTVEQKSEAVTETGSILGVDKIKG